MRNVIISGSTGYFGELACSYLSELGFNVYTAGRSEGCDYYFDLNEPVESSEVELVSPVDTYIHAAAVHEVDCLKEPYECINRNISGTRAALDFCVKNGIKKFIYISTFHVYGKDVGAIDENSETLALHDYGLTHLLAEEYVRMYTRKKLISGVCLRPSNMVDVPDDLDGFTRWSLIPFSFCKSAINDREIVLSTPGFQERNFVSVRDIVKVIEKIINNELEHEILNVPGVSTYSVIGFAGYIKDLLKQHYDIDIEVRSPEGKKETRRLEYVSDFIKPDELCFVDVKQHVLSLAERLLNND